jgi:hypothetical protein
MKLGTRHFVWMGLCLQAALLFLANLLLASTPAVAQQENLQRGNIGIDVGEVSDRFGDQPRFTDPVGDVNGELIVVRGSEKEGWPNVLAGGEIRFPTNTQNHATEFAFYGGLGFKVTNSFTAGFHVQLRKIYTPPSSIDDQTFNRDNMEFLQLPLFGEYKFGPGKNIFIRAEGEPEFHPHFKTSKRGPIPLPTPSLDHGYTLRGSVGYNFGRWYAKASYETRYLKFANNLGNPAGINNWRSDFVTGGVGLNF